MIDNIKALIEEYESAIELLEEDKRTEGMTISNAYRNGKIGVYGKVVLDLKELLEGEQEPSGDLISRQAVLDGIDTYIYKAQSTGTQDDFYSFAELVVKALPSVKQEPKTGHREYNDIYDHYLCGNCKTIVMDYDNFCPNCGADMRADKENKQWLN